MLRIDNNSPNLVVAFTHTADTGSGEARTTKEFANNLANATAHWLAYRRPSGFENLSLKRF
jgi:hypothetical protein